MSLLVVGSVALDTIKTPSGSRKDLLGGSAVYFSVSASFFTQVSLVAIVGEDLPRRHIDFLKKGRGINLDGLEVSRSGRTFRWSGEYGKDMNTPNTLCTHLNVFSSFSPKLNTDNRKKGFIFLANIDPELQLYVLRQAYSPRLVAADTMNFWIENKRSSLMKLLRRLDLFIINESEARLLSEEASLLRAAKRLLSLGPRRIIIKRGEHGAFYFSKRSLFWAPAYPLETIQDPTGAGDTFAGGFMGYLARHKELSEGNYRRAVIFGSVMASFVVEDFSVGRMRGLTQKEILARYREFRRFVHF